MHFDHISIIFVCDSLVVIARLTVQPQNTEVVLGGSTSFNCTTSEPYSVNWQHVPLGSTKLNDVYTSRVIVYPYHSRFKIEGNQTEGQYNLVIINAMYEDAGTLICIDNAGQGEEKRVELILFETPPSCKSSLNSSIVIGENDCGIEPDVVLFKCKLGFKGNIAPELKWTITGIKPIGPILKIVTREKLPNQVTTEVEVKPALYLDGHSIICQTSLSKYHWTSETIRVFSILNASDVKEISESSSELCIETNISTPCSYRWIKKTHFGEEILSVSPSLTISNPGSYSCLVECSIREHICTVQSLRLHFVENHECDPKWMILSSILIFTLCILLLIELLLFLLMRVRKSNSKQKNGVQGTPSIETASPVNEVTPFNGGKYTKMEGIFSGAPLLFGSADKI